MLVLLSVLGTAIPCCRSTGTAKHQGAKSTDTPASSESGAREHAAPATAQPVFLVECWIEAILLADPRGSYPVEAFLAENESADCPHPSPAPPGCPPREPYVPKCSGMSDEEINLFIVAGPRAIPRLIEHVHNHRPISTAFIFPASSLIQENLTVGEVACYMIEAILRKDPYFAYGPRPIFRSAILTLGYAEAKWLAQEQVATAYEEWFAECFDPESNTITCPEDKFPVLPWQYRLDKP